MVSKAVMRTMLLLGGSVSVAACTYSGEQVFTRQNQASSALATMGMEAELQDAAKADLIYAAETKLHEACAPLRTVASRRMSGEFVGLDHEFAALISLDRCHTETKRIETFIWLDNPTVARTYLGTKPVAGLDR